MKIQLHVSAEAMVCITLYGWFGLYISDNLNYRGLELMQAKQQAIVVKRRNGRETIKIDY